MKLHDSFLYIGYQNKKKTKSNEGYLSALWEFDKIVHLWDIIYHRQHSPLPIHLTTEHNSPHLVSTCLCIVGHLEITVRWMGKKERGKNEERFWFNLAISLAHLLLYKTLNSFILITKWVINLSNSTSVIKTVTLHLLNIASLLIHLL